MLHNIIYSVQFPCMSVPAHITPEKMTFLKIGTYVTSFETIVLSHI